MRDVISMVAQVLIKGEEVQRLLSEAERPLSEEDAAPILDLMRGQQLLLTQINEEMERERGG